MYKAGLVRYTAPYESLKKAVELAGGISDISPGSRVFIKPNLVVWFDGVPFPKYGVLTTARMIEDLVRLLHDHGITDITLVEGIAKEEPGQGGLLDLAAKGMGLDRLSKRYGLKMVDVHESGFTDIALDDVRLSVNSDILEADHIIDVPVLKTHSMCRVSLGIKNLKGLINIESRKRCHNADEQMNLDYHVSKLAQALSPTLTVIDGIYSLEYGPLIFGQARRSDVIVASRDLVSADKIGAALLGFAPDRVPHLAMAMAARKRVPDLSDLEINGDIPVEDAAAPHQFIREQSENGEMPQIFEDFGVKGVRLPRVDSTLCTYCVPFFAYATAGIVMSQNQDKTFDDIEILSGKRLEPSGSHKHTLLLGQCQVMRNRKHPGIKDCVMVKGCPPKQEDFIDAFATLGIRLPDPPLEWMKTLPGFFNMQYADKPEFEEGFYKI